MTDAKRQAARTTQTCALLSFAHACSAYAASAEGDPCGHLPSAPLAQSTVHTLAMHVHAGPKNRRGSDSCPWHWASEGLHRCQHQQDDDVKRRFKCQHRSCSGIHVRRDNANFTDSLADLTESAVLTALTMTTVDR